MSQSHPHPIESPPPLLRVENLSVRFNQTDILRQVSFALNAGEYLAIIGPNGAGKTTLVKTILGLNPDYTGQIFLQEQPLTHIQPKAKARYLAYVPQTQEVGEFHRVREFILMGRYPYLSAISPPQTNDQDIVDAVMTQTGVTPLADRLVHTLSGGERQKVMIAAALAQQPDILLLDEPATFLDPKNQIEIQRLLRHINRQTGTTIVAITHDLNSALHDATRILGLKDGQIQLDGSPENTLTPTHLTALFDAPFLALPAPNGGAHWLVPDLKEGGS